MDRYGDAPSQRQQEEQQWRLAQPTGAGAGPVRTPPLPLAVGARAAGGVVVGAGVGAAIKATQAEGGIPDAAFRDDATGRLAP